MTMLSGHAVVLRCLLVSFSDADERHIEHSALITWVLQPQQVSCSMQAFSVQRGTCFVLC